MLQDLTGCARGEHGNDRNQMGFENGQDLLQYAFNLCIAAIGGTEKELETAMTAARDGIYKIRRYHDLLAETRQQKKGQA